MRLGLFAEDDWLANGVQTHFLIELEYNEHIPWKIIQEVERFLHLKIIVCDSYGAEILKNDFCHMEQLDNISNECVQCSSDNEFLRILHDEIVEHFCDYISVDQIDAVFYRGG